MDSRFTWYGAFKGTDPMLYQTIKDRVETITILVILPLIGVVTIVGAFILEA